MTGNKIPLTVIVNGVQTLIEANTHAPLSSIIPKALVQTHNGGQPPGNWELRDVQGTLLDINQAISSFNFPLGVQLFLNLKAGVGGSM